LAEQWGREKYWLERPNCFENSWTTVSEVTIEDHDVDDHLTARSAWCLLKFEIWIGVVFVIIWSDT
jgi:hypothetical protein